MIHVFLSVCVSAKQHLARKSQDQGCVSVSGGVEEYKQTQTISEQKIFTGKGGLGSTKFVAFETLAWHNECFICNICKGSMVGKGFIQVKNLTLKTEQYYF